jgi:polygalacturonase
MHTLTSGRWTRRATLGHTLALGAYAATPARQAAAQTDPWLDAAATVARIKVPSFPARDYIVTNYGARGDGRTLCTQAINSAVQACNAAGGGRVVIPATGSARTFLTGAIRLRGNVNLFIAPGATLRFSADTNQYLPVVQTSFEGSDCYNYCPLIYAPWRTNVAITGAGTLDGGASNQSWWPWSGRTEYGWSSGMPNQIPDSRNLRNQNAAHVPINQRSYGSGHYLRPPLVQMFRSTNVLLQDFTAVNGPFWMLHLLFCRSVTVRNVTVRSLGPNNDGCDIECCNDVLIQDCHFDTGDDCIAIKSGRAEDGLRRAAPSHDIVVRRTLVSHGGGGIAIGSEQGGGVHDVFVEDLTRDSQELSDGLLLKANRQYGPGVVERIHARRIQLAGVRNGAITINLKIYNIVDGLYHPAVRDVEVTEMICNKSRNALKLIGLPESKISDIRVADSSFSNVSGTGIARSDVTGLQVSNVKINGTSIG